ERYLDTERIDLAFLHASEMPEWAAAELVPRRPTECQRRKKSQRSGGWDERHGPARFFGEEDDIASAAGGGKFVACGRNDMNAPRAVALHAHSAFLGQAIGVIRIPRADA